MRGGPVARPPPLARPVPAGGSWSLRLLQLQVSAIYLAAAAAKLQGDAWRDGDAVALALGVPQAARFPAPEVLTTSPAAAQLLTWGTIGLEAAIAILVWNGRLRPWVLAAGACFHLAIDYSLRAGFFSWAMLVCYLAFVNPDAAARLIERASERLRSLHERFGATPVHVEGSYVGRADANRPTRSRGRSRPAEGPFAGPLPAICARKADA